MKNTIVAVSLVSMFSFGVVACSAETRDGDEGGNSEEALAPSPVRGCLAKITADRRSPQYLEEVNKCLTGIAPAPGKLDGGPPGTSDGGPSTGTSTSCKQGTACTNGVCKCTEGPNTGIECDGKAISGGGSCSELCKVCVTK
jgi:hypothetical protein